MSTVQASAGFLYLVATPIGNVEDIGQRALRTLEQCDAIACEDTRKTGRLLETLGISAHLYSYHEHNEQQRAADLADRLTRGETIALVVDAGTPAISDPGFRLVRECRRRGLPVVPIPGASAAVTALSASGLPSDGFLFLGFLPSKVKARRTIFERYRDLPFTLIFYESCYRIDRCLGDLVAVLEPERTVCIARELTKRYESFYVGRAKEVLDQLLRESRKGEFVVLVAKSGYLL